MDIKEEMGLTYKGTIKRNQTTLLMTITQHEGIQILILVHQDTRQEIMTLGTDQIMVQVQKEDQKVVGKQLL